MDFTSYFLVPDGWQIGNTLRPSDGYSDISFPGCQYRLPTSNDYGNRYMLAVNVSISGRKSHMVDFNRYKTRVKIEFVGDGEPSTFHRGFVYSDMPLI